MSHSLYELSQESNHTVYRLLRKIRLTAESGTIASFVRDARGTEPGGWHMTERDLLNRVGTDPDSQAVVVDLKPSAKDIADLYRMRGIIGYSHADWTPICFLLEHLANEPTPDPESFKREFKCERGFQGKRAVSFVYLRRGTQGGRAWNWGHVGRVNGPILFPEAWHHFDHELRSSGWFVDSSELIDEDRQPA